MKVMQLYKSRNSQGSPHRLQHIGTSGFPLAAHTMLQTDLCLGTCKWTPESHECLSIMLELSNIQCLAPKLSLLTWPARSHNPVPD